MDIGYVDSLAIHPPFSFRLAEKKTGRTRRGYAASVSGTAANGCAMDGPKEKTLGANLHVRASLLKTGVFRICADWNRKSFAGSRRTCSVAEDWLPRVRFGGDFVGGSGHPLFLFPLALPWCLRGGKFSGNLKMTCGAGLLGRNFLIESGQKEGTIDAEISKH